MAVRAVAKLQRQGGDGATDGKAAAAEEEQLAIDAGSADQYIRPGRRGRGFTRRRSVRYIDHWTAMHVQYRETGMVAAPATAAGCSC